MLSVLTESVFGPLNSSVFWIISGGGEKKSIYLLIVPDCVSLCAGVWVRAVVQMEIEILNVIYDIL